MILVIYIYSVGKYIRDSQILSIWRAHHFLFRAPPLAPRQPKILFQNLAEFIFLNWKWTERDWLMPNEDKEYNGSDIRAGS